MTSKYATLTAPVTLLTPTSLIDQDTGLTFVVPAGRCLTRLCVFQPAGSTTLTGGLNVQVGTSGNTGAFIPLTDLLSTTSLNNNIAYNKTIASYLSSSSDVTPTITLSGNMSAGTFWVEFVLSNN